MKRYYRKNRPSVALFLVSNLLAAGSSVFMSFLLGAFADSAMEGDLSRVWKIALVTLFYLCIETFFAFLLDYSRDIVVQRVGRGLRADAVRKIEALSYMEKSEKDDGACLSLVQNDVDTIQQDYVAALGEIYFQICCFLLAVASTSSIPIPALGSTVTLPCVWRERTAGVGNRHGPYPSPWPSIRSWCSLCAGSGVTPL